MPPRVLDCVCVGRFVGEADKLPFLVVDRLMCQVHVSEAGSDVDVYSCAVGHQGRSRGDKLPHDVINCSFFAVGYPNHEHSDGLYLFGGCFIVVVIGGRHATFDPADDPDLSLFSRKASSLVILSTNEETRTDSSISTTLPGPPNFCASLLRTTCKLNAIV